MDGEMKQLDEITAEEVRAFASDSEQCRRLVCEAIGVKWSLSRAHLYYPVCVWHRFLIRKVIDAGLMVEISLASPGVAVTLERPLGRSTHEVAVNSEDDLDAALCLALERAIIIHTIRERGDDEP